MKTLRVSLAWIMAVLMLGFGVAGPLCAVDTTKEIQELEKRLENLKASQEAQKQNSPAVLTQIEYEEFLELVQEVRESQLAAEKARRIERPSRGNPDRYPSIGFSYSFTPGLDGEYTVYSALYGKESQTGTGTQGAFLMDLRLPVSDTMTLFTGGGFQSSESEYPESLGFYGSRSTWSGVYFVIGVRFYFIPQYGPSSTGDR